MIWAQQQTALHILVANVLPCLLKIGAEKNVCVCACVCCSAMKGGRKEGHCIAYELHILSIFSMDCLEADVFDVFNHVHI